MPRAKILIVEDSVTMRQLIGFALKRLGDVTVLEAGDGLEGLKIIRDGGIDVALVDINMPVMDGLKLIKSVRQEPQIKDLPIIVITTESGSEYVEKAKSLGVSRYITKPIRQSEVVDTVREILKEK